MNKGAISIFPHRLRFSIHLDKYLGLLVLDQMVK